MQYHIEPKIGYLYLHNESHLFNSKQALNAIDIIIQIWWQQKWSEIAQNMWNIMKLNQNE